MFHTNLSVYSHMIGRLQYIYQLSDVIIVHTTHAVLYDIDECRLYTPSIYYVVCHVLYMFHAELLHIATCIYNAKVNKNQFFSEMRQNKIIRDPTKTDEQMTSYLIAADSFYHMHIVLSTYPREYKVSLYLQLASIILVD